MEGLRPLQSDPEELLIYEKKQIRTLISHLKSNVEHTNMENLMYERFIRKINATDKLVSRDELGSMNAKLHVSSASLGVISCVERFARLTPEQMCEIAQYECEEFKNDMKSFERDCCSIVAHYQAAMEEMELSLKELSHRKICFRKNVGDLLESERLKHYSHDAFTWFHISYLRKLDVLAHNLHLENVKLQRQRKRFTNLLKEHMTKTSSLHLIDIEYLKLRLTMLLKHVKTINSACLRHKWLMIECTRICDECKLKLEKELRESLQLTHNCMQRSEFNKLVERGIRNLQLDFSVEKAENANLKELQHQSSVVCAPLFVETFENSKDSDRMNKDLHLDKLQIMRHKRIWRHVNGWSRKASGNCLKRNSGRQPHLLQ